MKSCGAALLAATLMASATAQLTFSDDAGGESTAVAEVVQLEAGDDQSTVGELVVFASVDCATLALAEDAASLEIPFSPSETITADKVLFETKDGSHFEDNTARLTWNGIVTSPAQAADEMAPSEISMTWSDPCEIQTFVLTMTSFKTDGSTVVKKSIPCEAGADVNICMVDVTVETFYEDSGLIEEDETRRNLRSVLSNIPLTRKLQDSASVDVMFLYTEAALVQMGGISPAQMTSIIFGALASTNAAFVNSGIDLIFNLAFVGLFSGTEDSSSAVNTVTALRADADVAALRTTYQADLVQLVGHFDTSCSAGYNFNGNPLNGFSVVNPICIDNFSHSHVFGRNLGCFRNREDSLVQKDYQHGYRICDGTDPFSTIMSLKCPATQAPRINYFSNPLISYEGQPTGTDTEDCARAIILNMGAVEAFQPVGVTDAPSTAPPTTAPPTTATPTTAPPTTAPPSSAPTTDYSYLGCWTDDVSDRVFSGGSLKGQSDMTTEKCAAYCAGPRSAYFATQFGGECFCGLSTDDPEENGPSTECNMPCTGDADEVCGGNKALSVYEYPRYSYVDCFADQQSDRVLSGTKTVDADMTADLCYELCAGAPLFGTEYSNECFCGTDGDSPEVTSTACDFACSGDPDEVCGGNNAISIYMPLEVGSGLGCYADMGSDRIFEKALTDSSMTTALCAETCTGYKYYGTQYSNECWCGDDDTFDRHGTSADCTMGCAGAPGEFCGGGFAMNVYMS